MSNFEAAKWIWAAGMALGTDTLAQAVRDALTFDREYALVCIGQLRKWYRRSRRERARFPWRDWRDERRFLVFARTLLRSA